MKPAADIGDLKAWADAQMMREPDFIIGESANPYLRRWWIVPRNEFCNAYLHEILRSDDDRAGHDHPWHNRSLVIDGGYEETLFDPIRPWEIMERAWLAPGSVVTRSAQDTHRLALPDGGRAISLFMTGQKVRDWGFWCPSGQWVHWQDFTSGENGSLVGRGCGE